MRCDNPGKICDGLWYLGHRESGVYLLEGSNRSLIVSGGTSYIVPLVMSQLQTFSLREERISAILILHAHFDHIGIIPFFRRRKPDMIVYGSKRAWQILSVPQNIRTINEFSHRIAERMGCGNLGEELEWPEGLQGTVIHEGDVIDLGDLTVEIMETPGHSSCSITAYAPQIRALFPSDGGGIPYKGAIAAAPNSNFDQYRASLERMDKKVLDYICADHFGYVYGSEARTYIRNSIKALDEKFALMASIYRRSRDVAIAAKEAASSFLAQNPDYFLTQEIYEGVCRQMMKHIARTLES